MGGLTGGLKLTDWALRQAIFGRLPLHFQSYENIPLARCKEVFTAACSVFRFRAALLFAHSDISLPRKCGFFKIMGGMSDGFKLTDWALRQALLAAFALTVVWKSPSAKCKEVFTVVFSVFRAAVLFIRTYRCHAMRLFQNYGRYVWWL